MFSLAFEEDPCLAEDPAVNSQKISESCRAPAGCSSLPNPRGANPLPPEPKVLVLDGLRIFQHVHRRGTAARVYKATPSELEPRVEESVSAHRGSARGPKLENKTNPYRSRGEVAARALFQNWEKTL